MKNKDKDNENGDKENGGKAERGKTWISVALPRETYARIHAAAKFNHRSVGGELLYGYETYERSAKRKGA